MAEKAWAKFKNREFTKVLEPSAGDGALLDPRYKNHRIYLRDCDVVEIDISKHPLLREKGFNVIGLDFMKLEAGSLYSHIVMNPPFAQGAQHTLKAWDILFDGEIVAILNKETIENPYTKERKLLVNLIKEHGEVEYLTEAFMSADTLRKTNVEIALVYLCKKSNYYDNLAGEIMEGLKVEMQQDTNHGYEALHEVALTNTNIQNAVIRFKAAVIANKQQVIATARANYYRSILGSTMEQMHSNAKSGEYSVAWVTSNINEMYRDLKNRAWANVLRSSDFLSKLSTAAQKTVENDFENIKKLEFTEENIRGFLLGVVERQGDIQNEMLLNCFTEITKYHSDNTVFYMGWVSNTKHRLAGMRIKMTRFVLPNFRTSNGSMEWRCLRQLSDFDKVFELLAGKVIHTPEPGKPMVENGLEDVVNRCIEQLRNGERVKTKYFDLRFYPGRGTLHFFPTDKAIIERFNRTVGRLKAWLPEHGSGNEEFEAHYQDAEKFDKELKESMAKNSDAWRFRNVSYWLDSADEFERQRANNLITDPLKEILTRRGYNVDLMLTENKPLQLTA